MNRPKAGYSFFEILVVLALTGLLVVAVYEVAINGWAFYRDSSDGLEVRQEALLGITRLTQDLRDSSRDSLLLSPSPSGITFASIRDAQGEVPATHDGHQAWQQLVCIYLEPSSEPNQGPSRMLRKAENLSPPRDRAPDPSSLAPVRNTAYFSKLPGAPRQLARRVVSLEARPTVDAVSIKLVCLVSSRHESHFELETKVIPHR